MKSQLVTLQTATKHQNYFLFPEKSLIKEVRRQDKLCPRRFQTSLVCPSGHLCSLRGRPVGKQLVFYSIAVIDIICLFIILGEMKYGKIMNVDVDKKGVNVSFKTKGKQGHKLISLRSILSISANEWLLKVVSIF